VISDWSYSKKKLTSETCKINFKIDLLPYWQNMKTHKDLNVWQNSIDFVTKIYAISKDFPKEETFGLQSQLRRAAISIPSNISEGASRNSKKEFIQFLYVALGSASEVETQIIIANKIGYIADVDPLLKEIDSIKKMLNGLISYLKKQKK
jgi:four helix bundle protein